MKNFVQPGDAIDFVAPSGGVVGGAGFLLGALFGVVRHSAAQGVQSILDTRGVFTLPKAATITPAPGAALYWDDTAKNVTTTVGSNVKIGAHAGLAAAGAADATLPVRLNGIAVMACRGCAQRAGLIGQGVRAVQRGAWQEAAQAASATAQSFRADAAKIAAKLAQAVAAAKGRGR